MQLGYESLKGLDRDRIISVVEPVLHAHGVDAVELIWRSDQRGWVLYLTVEKPLSSEPSAGVTLDLCADISRDLSAALDLAGAIDGPRYRLEVGSPGVERGLYELRDYDRFSGREAKLKLSAAVDGQKVLRGTLKGVLPEGHVILLSVEGREHRLAFDQIESGRLSFDWQTARGLPNGAARDRRPGARRAPPRDKSDR